MIKASALSVYVCVVGLAGYALVASVTNILPIPNNLVSIVMRSSVALASLMIIVMNVGKRTQRPVDAALGLAMAFWVMYFLRILHDTTFTPETLAFSQSYYFIWSLGGSFLPMFALATWEPRVTELHRTSQVLYVSFLIAGLLVALSVFVAELPRAHDPSRFRLASLNPIAVGQLGTTIMILSLWAMIYRTHKTTWNTALLVSGGVLGLLVTIIANSKGPLVAAAACAAFLVLSPQVRRRSRYLLVVALLVGAVVPISIVLENGFGFATYSRLFGQSQLGDAGVVARIELYRSAVEAFLRSPWVGAGLENTPYSYPHNVIIEAFMATGVFGGLAFLVMLLLLAAKALRCWNHMSTHGWVALLFIQHAVAAQFSGALYSVVYFWLLAGLMMALPMRETSDVRRAAEQQPA